MTRVGSLWLTGVSIILLAAVPAGAAPGHQGSPPGLAGRAAEVRHAGQSYCPTTALVAGNVVIPAGQCFTLAVLHNASGTFLAFVPAGARIPPGQLVRLNTPAGLKLRGRLFLVPITTSTILVPLNTMQLVMTSIIIAATQILINVLGFPVTVPPIVLTPRH